MAPTVSHDHATGETAFAADSAWLADDIAIAIARTIDRTYALASVYRPENLGVPYEVIVDIDEMNLTPRMVR